MKRYFKQYFNIFVAPKKSLGTIIASKEDEDTIKEGLKLLKTILPRSAFYNKGQEAGPTIFTKCFEKCLQALWRWLSTELGTRAGKFSSRWAASRPLVSLNFHTHFFHNNFQPAGSISSSRLAKFGYAFFVH